MMAHTGPAFRAQHTLVRVLQYGACVCWEPSDQCVLSSSGPQATLGSDVCANHWILETHSREHAGRSACRVLLRGLKGLGHWDWGAELLLSAEL